MSEKEAEKQPVTDAAQTNEESSQDTVKDQAVSAPAPETPKVDAVYSAVEPVGKAKSKVGMYIAAVAIVGITLLVVLFMLEKEGRSSTGVFDSYFAGQVDATVVAVVNGTEITGRDLNTSIQQFTQAAIAQGVDVSNPDVQGDIRAQALEVLVNTELLKQAADEQNISVSDEEAAARLEAIELEIGGAEVLESRIQELGLTRADLAEDIEEELLIQSLLEVIFADAAIEITEEEVLAIYGAAGGEEAGLPPLEEVREQVEAQVRSTKEQQVVDEYLQTLKTDAEIEVTE